MVVREGGGVEGGEEGWGGGSLNSHRQWLSVKRDERPADSKATFY